MRNCTAAETKEYIVKKYGFDCQEGGYCRFIQPNHYFCECLSGWTGQLCQDPDFFPSRSESPAMMSVYLPLVGIFLLLVIVVAVIVGYCVIRRRQSVGQNNHGGGDNSSASISGRNC